MLHHRAAYDSIEPGEVTSLTGNHEVQPLRRDGHLSKKKMIVASLFLLGVVALFASNQSLMLLAELPLIGKGFRKWNAQNLADDFRATYLSERQLHHQISSRRDQQAKFQAQDGCESTVVILRHCEKGRIREHCSYVGYERSVYLASIFGNDDERWPAPSYIYALRAGQRHNPEKKVYREMETILPLAIKSNVTVNDSYDTRHASSLAQEVSLMLRSGEMCGKVVVICWKHSNIPHLAHKLGCGPEQGCPADYPSFTFDQAWQIKFVYQKLLHSERKNHKIPKHDMWEIYGNVEDEGFDPLSFSKKSGDYVPGQSVHSAKWMARDVEIPETGLPRGGLKEIIEQH